MDSIIQERKKGERNFRNKVDQFLIKSPFTKQNQQLNPQTLTQIMQMPYFDGVCTNGKLNVDKLCEKITTNDSKYSSKDLFKVLGGKKEMKLTDLHQLLKNYQLTQFDLQQEMTKLLFTGNTLSSSKIDQVMKSLGQSPLTPKDKQILIECFDYDCDGVVSLQDIQHMLQLCKQNINDLRSTQYG